MRIAAFAGIVVVRGRIDEAQEAYGESARILDENPEPQVDIYRRSLEAAIARGRGDREQELDRLRAVSELSGLFEFAPEVFPEVARRAIEAGDRALADGLRDLSANVVFPAAHAATLNIRGLLAAEPGDQVRLLGEAAGLFDELGMAVLQAQALLDLGRAEARLGRDPRSSFERSRDLLIACDAQLYLPEANDALAALEASEPAP
jgi:hypothetical protein